ncbi:hypothetical protein O6H91_05G040000 [Diphasiastrum complanatum]|uniref:Uncharacterized protein n=1 Tax=Diphasiastrum complanatum TaxID=34168 RepID=A0ACC2DMS1_DIPCM|nr:hypothetical protein O6H91_05G040000 [Diphasiastrum complanatum]
MAMEKKKIRKVMARKRDREKRRAVRVSVRALISTRYSPLRFSPRAPLTRALSSTARQNHVAKSEPLPSHPMVGRPKSFRAINIPPTKKAGWSLMAPSAAALGCLTRGIMPVAAFAMVSLIKRGKI